MVKPTTAFSTRSLTMVIPRKSRYYRDNRVGITMVKAGEKLTTHQKTLPSAHGFLEFTTSILSQLSIVEGLKPSRCKVLDEEDGKWKNATVLEVHGDMVEVAFSKKSLGEHEVPSECVQLIEGPVFVPNILSL